jgi:GNAT superfamily N-acetyltransferase
MFALRIATMADVPQLEALIALSVRGLQANDYTSEQLELALAHVYGVDTQIVADGTYFVVESNEGGDGPRAIGCGGWSKRKTLYGGDRVQGRHDALLDPARDAAKIRAFFVHPAWARRGIASQILGACERAAIDAGFTRLEMGATLTGVPFYAARGYEARERALVPLPNALSMAIVMMEKPIGVD